MTVTVAAFTELGWPGLRVAAGPGDRVTGTVTSAVRVRAGSSLSQPTAVGCAAGRPG